MASRHFHAVLNRLCSNPYRATESVPLRVLQELMLETDGSTMAGGLWFNIVSVRLCPGVYNISLKLKEA